MLLNHEEKFKNTYSIGEKIMSLCTGHEMKKENMTTARPRDTRPQGVRTLEIHGF